METIGTIGKKCECIDEADRQEILIAINDLIEHRKREFENIKKILTEKKMIRHGDKFKHPTVITYEGLLTKSEKVKKRIENTPECF